MLLVLVRHVICLFYPDTGSLRQITQIAYDIINQGYYLPPLPEDKIIDTGVLAVKDVMIGDRDPANTLWLFLSGLR